MSKSPLSGAFSGSSEPAKKKNKKNGAILLISGIALTSSIGGVFAAGSITLNGTDELEFGQGVAEVLVCNNAADVTVNQTYDTTDGEFYVTTVDVVFVSASGACDGLDATAGLVLDDAGTITFESLTQEVGTVTADEVSFDFTADEFPASQVSDVTVTTAE